MKLEKLTVQILGVTIGCFALSYGAAVMGGISGRGYPKEVVKLYADRGNHLQEISFDKTIPAAQARELELISVNFDFILKQVDGDQIQVKLRGKSFSPQKPIEVTVEGDKITIRPPETKNKHEFGINFDHEQGRMEVEIPKRIAHLKLKTVSGDVTMTGFALNDFDLKSVSGDATVEGGHIDRVTMASVSGDIKASGTIGAITVASVSGDVEAEFENDAPTVEVHTTSGDGSVKFKNKPNVHLDFSTMSGDFSLDPEFGNVINEGRKLSMNIGDGKGSLSVHTISGDMKVGKF